MSKFDLFKKLNLLIEISGILNDPQYGGILNVSRIPPAKAYVSVFGELSASSDIKCIDVYPNPMAVKFLLGVCEDVLISKVPNRKDEFQLVALAFQLATSRALNAINNNESSDFGDCDNLMLDYRGGKRYGSSTGSEVRSALEAFNLRDQHVESALSNTLTEPLNSTYIRHLPIDPVVCLFANHIDNPYLRSFVSKYILGPEPSDDAVVMDVDMLSCLSMMGIAKAGKEIYLDMDQSDIGVTRLGKSLNVDFETAFIHWGSEATKNFSIESDWYNQAIAPVTGLSKVIWQLFNWDNFAALKYDTQLEWDIRNKNTKPSAPKRDPRHLLAEIEKLGDESKPMNELLDNTLIRMTLVKYGLIVRNPLYNAGNEVLKHNPPIILSGFGVVVARYIGSLGI